MKRMFWIVPMALTVALAAVSLPAVPVMAQSGSGNGSEIRTRINLTGAAINGILPKGRAEFRSSSSFRSFKVQVEQVSLADGMALNVAVNGTGVGMLTLTLRRGEMELSTKDRQVTPAIKTGDVVTVTTSAGAVILQGKF
jgi:hypothetical protein